MANVFTPYTRRQSMIAGDYEVYRYQTPDVDEVLLHHHDFYEIYLLIRGNVSYTVENHVYRMQPGDMMLVSPLELHQARIATGEPYERIVLWVSCSFLEDLSSRGTDLTRCFDTSAPGHTNLLRLPTPDGATLRRKLERLCSLQGSGSYGSDLLARSCLTQVMVALNLAAMEGSNGSDSGDCRSDRVVDSVVAYIHEHYQEPLTLDDLARQFYISKYHLIRKFDDQMGTTVHRYILQKRLLLARQQLTAGISPSAASENCGFGDYANFYRAFRKEYGITPREFIKASHIQENRADTVKA